MAAIELKALQTNAKATEVAKRPKTLFDFLEDQKFKTAIGAVAAQYMTPDRYLRLAINAVKKTPLLMECDPQTVLGSFMASAALGLEPNTNLQQAFLIPYGKNVKRDNEWVKVYECQFQVGYRGFITLSHRSPNIDSLQGEAIHEKDLFEHMLGTDSFLRYQKKLKDRGELIGAFAYSKLASGCEISTVLPLEELMKIRGKSETYSALLRNVKSATDARERDRAQQKLNETPWVMWEDDMCAKSAIKKHAKQLPLAPGDVFAAGVALDTDGDDRTIDMASLTEVETMRTVVQEGYVPEKDQPLAVGQQEGDYLEPQIIRPLDKVEVEQQQATQQAKAATSNGVTFAHLNKRFYSATDIDDLDADAALIREVDGIAQQTELTAIYKERRAALDIPPPAARAPRMQMSVE
jgi:phage RecT family recombinase